MGGEVAVLTMDRPKAKNAIRRQLLESLRSELLAVAAAPVAKRPRAVVLARPLLVHLRRRRLRERGTMTPDEARKFVTRYALQLPRLRASCPTVATVDGYALGGGFEMALACALCVAGSAQSSAYRKRARDYSGAGGTQRLARRVGGVRAKEMVLAGRFGAQEALDAGVATEAATAAPANALMRHRRSPSASRATARRSQQRPQNAPLTRALSWRSARASSSSASAMRPCSGRRTGSRRSPPSPRSAGPSFRESECGVARSRARVLRALSACVYCWWAQLIRDGFAPYFVVGLVGDGSTSPWVKVPAGGTAGPRDRERAARTRKARRRTTTVHICADDELRIRTRHACSTTSSF